MVPAIAIISNPIYWVLFLSPEIYFRAAIANLTPFTVPLSLTPVKLRRFLRWHRVDNQARADFHAGPNAAARGNFHV